MFAILNYNIFLCSGVRANLAAWIQKLECGGDLEKQAFFKKKFLQRLRESPVAIDTDKANEQHYEVPSEFFLTVRNVMTLLHLLLSLKIVSLCHQYRARLD